MTISTHKVLARFFIDGGAMCADRHVTDVIMDRARRSPLPGATLLRALGGFGRSHQIHGGGGFDLSQDAPFVIEIVDDEQALRTFIDQLSDLRIGLVTLERLEVVHRGTVAVGRAT